MGVCVTLNEGYLRSANRGSNNLYRFLMKNITDQPSMKRRVFWSVFFNVFSRLPIYESIAAIFWQSASYLYTSISLTSLSLRNRSMFNYKMPSK